MNHARVAFIENATPCKQAKLILQKIKRKLTTRVVWFFRGNSKRVCVCVCIDIFLLNWIFTSSFTVKNIYQTGGTHGQDFSRNRTIDSRALWSIKARLTHRSWLYSNFTTWYHLQKTHTDSHTSYFTGAKLWAIEFSPMTAVSSSE